MYSPVLPWPTPQLVGATMILTTRTFRTPASFILYFGHRIASRVVGVCRHGLIARSSGATLRLVFRAPLRPQEGVESAVDPLQYGTCSGAMGGSYNGARIDRKAQVSDATLMVKAWARCPGPQGCAVWRWHCDYDTQRWHMSRRAMASPPCF